MITKIVTPTSANIAKDKLLNPKAAKIKKRNFIAIANIILNLIIPTAFLPSLIR